MAFKPVKRAPLLDPRLLRIRRLERTAKAAAWWLLFLGYLYLATGNHFSVWFRLRYLTVAAPLMRSLGICYALLGLYLRRSLAEPENQYFAVDMLTLFFCAQVIVATSTLASGESLFAGEWAIAAANLGFAVALMLLRTKSTAMAEGAPEGKDAKAAAAETIARLKELLQERKRATPLPSAEISPPPGEEKKSVSEAAPTLE